MMDPNWHDFDWWAWLAAHTVAGGSVVAAAVGVLPAIAALVGIMFYLIQIYESTTVRAWVERCQQRRINRLQRKLDRLLRRD